MRNAPTSMLLMDEPHENPMRSVMNLKQSPTVPSRICGMSRMTATATAPAIARPASLVISARSPLCLARM